MHVSMRQSNKTVVLSDECLEVLQPDEPHNIVSYS